jgi:DeoR/GlpR family transcriptional regulator of sugar metabolism
MSTADIRRHQILQHHREAGEVRVSELVARFGVSPATARRHLRALERQGLALRCHGGATTPEAPLYEPSFKERERVFITEKRQIALAAAALVRNGETIALTGGTTTSLVARALGGRAPIIVTNSVNIALELAREAETRIHLTGGRLRAPSYELVGPAAVQALQGLNVEVAFIGVSGISVERGPTTLNEEEAEVNRAMVNAAQRVVVVADHSKLGKTRLVQVCPINAVHTLVTDRDADAGIIEDLKRAGVEVILA